MDAGSGVPSDKVARLVAAVEALVTGLAERIREGGVVVEEVVYEEHVAEAYAAAEDVIVGMQEGVDRMEATTHGKRLHAAASRLGVW